MKFKVHSLNKINIKDKINQHLNLRNEIDGTQTNTNFGDKKNTHLIIKTSLN